MDSEKAEQADEVIPIDKRIVRYRVYYHTNIVTDVYYIQRSTLYHLLSRSTLYYVHGSTRL
jgi:hypothetical protein